MVFCNKCGNPCKTEAKFCPKCGNLLVNRNLYNNNVIQNNNNNNIVLNNNKPKKKKKVGKIIFLIILIIVISFFYFSSRKPKEDSLINVSKDYSFLGVTNENEYIISGASSDISFYVTEGTDYKVYDEHGNQIDVKMKDYKVYNPNKYEEGKTYIIEIDNGHFVSSQLKDTKKVKFKIERETVKKYKFKDELKKENLDQVNINENKLFSSNNYNVDDIIVIYDNKKMIDAYVIVGGNNYEYEVRKARIDELYSELNFYYEEYVDLSNYETSKAIENYIVSSIENSEWYGILFEEVSAKPKVEIKLKKVENGIKADIKLSLKPGEKSVLIDSKKHKIEFTFSQIFEAKMLTDVTLTNWDVKLDLALRSTFDFNIKNSIVDYNKKQPNKSLIEKIYKTLNDKNNTDSTEKEIELVTIPIPTLVPGLTIDIGLDLESTLKMAIDFKFAIDTKQNIVVGFDYGFNEEFTPIGSFEHELNDVSIEFAGNLEKTLGLEVSIGLGFVGVVEADITAKTGVYSNAKLSIENNIINKNYKMNFNFDAGLFAEIGLEAEFLSYNKNFKVLKKEFSLYKDEYEKIYTYDIEENVSELVNKNNELINENVLLQNNSCINREEQSTDYEKYKFNYDEKGNLKSVEMISSVYIDTGTDWLDEFLKIICKIILVYFDITYKTFGYCNEYGNRIEFIFPIKYNDIYEQLGIGNDQNFDYGYLKSYMESKGYTCK